MSNDSQQKKPWAKPDFQEIALCMEVTAYVNTGDEMPSDPVDVKLSRHVTDSTGGPGRESDS